MTLPPMSLFSNPDWRHSWERIRKVVRIEMLLIQVDAKALYDPMYDQFACIEKSRMPFRYSYVMDLPFLASPLGYEFTLL